MHIVACRYDRHDDQLIAHWKSVQAKAVIVVTPVSMTLGINASALLSIHALRFLQVVKQ